MKASLKLTRASAFVASMIECMPNTAPVRDTANFVRLVLLHPAPPPELAALHLSLWHLVTMVPTDDLAVATEIRKTAGRVMGECNASINGTLLEIALFTLALRFDDRPSMRMLVVDLATLVVGRSVTRVDDVSVCWDDKSNTPSVMSPGPVYQWIGHHVSLACAFLSRRGRHSSAFENLSTAELGNGVLALRLQYAMFHRGLDGTNLDSEALARDFELNGAPLWDAVQVVLEAKPLIESEPQVIMQRAWHLSARRLVVQAIEPVIDARIPAASKSAPSPPVSTASPNVGAIDAPVIPQGQPSLVVCRNPILESHDRIDKEEIARHKILEHPLPLATMPHADEVREQHLKLLAEFPWAGDVLAAIFGDLLGRAKLGIQTFSMPPTLLVGTAGSGKSRIAGRLADVFRLPRMDLSVGGTSDTKVLSGTSRGWGCGKPGDLATLMALRKSASAMVLLDELDKTADHGFREGGGLQSFLLGYMEPETARRLMDVYLKTECDYSGVIWVATANAVSTLQAPLLSRLRVLMLRQPKREHYSVIAENVLVERAKTWSLERGVLPELGELEIPWDQLASARQVRQATEGAVMRWAGKLQRH